MGGTDAIAVGDGGQPLDVGTQNLREGTGLGLAQFGELGGHVRDRAVMLADLDSLRVAHGLGRGRVAVLGQGLRHRRGAGGDRHAGVDIWLQFRSKPGRTMLGECHDGLLAAGLTQVAQRGVRKIVVGMRKRGTARVGERIGTGRTAAAAVRSRSRLAFDEQSIGNQRIEVPADRGGAQAEPLGKLRGVLRAAFKDAARDRIARPLVPGSEFHNTSMTYFCAGFTPAPPIRPYLGTT